MSRDGCSRAPSTVVRATTACRSLRKSLRDRRAFLYAAPMPHVLAMPSDQVEKLRVLRDLDPGAIPKVARRLTDGAVITRVRELEGVLKNELGDQGADLAEVLTGIAVLARSSTAQEIFGDLTETIRRRAVPSWDPEEFERWKGVQAGLDELLAVEQYLALGKAINLRYAHANVFQAAQIITDVRPVFNRDGTTPLSLVISHTLEVRYARGTSRQSITLSVDARDVKTLRELCDRADKKAGALVHYFSEHHGPLPVVLAGQGDDE